MALASDANGGRIALVTGGGTGDLDAGGLAAPPPQSESV
jgi:hypothetical protein